MATAKMYGLCAKSAFEGRINFLTDTMKVMLCTSLYSPNQDTHQFKSDVTSEVSATGYIAGGQTLASKTLVYDGSTNTLKFDAADVNWPNSSITARYAVVYDDTPSTDATKPLLFYVDFGSDQTTANTTFTLTWNATAMFTATVA